MERDRLYHRIAAIITIVIFGLMIWDILGNDSRLFLPLLIILAVHLVVELGVILWTWFFGHREAIKTEDSEKYRRVVVYERVEPEPKTFQKVEVKPKAAPAKAAPAKKKPAGRTDYKGDVHEVVDLEGIGPTYARRLMDDGIVHTQHLLFASDARIVKLTGARKEQVRLWKVMSQLVKVNGIGPQYAEALARAGVDLEKLRTGEPAKLASQVKAYLDGLKTNVVSGGVGAKRIAAWQTEAKKLRRVPIDLNAIEPVRLESRAAKSTGVAKTASKARKSPIGA